MGLSLKERDRISVLRQVKEGVLSVSAGAGRLGSRHGILVGCAGGSRLRAMRPWCTDCAGGVRTGRCRTSIALLDREDHSRTYDWVIEVVDPGPGRVLASRRFGEFLRYHPRSRILVSRVDTILTAVAYDVWEPTLQQGR